MDDGDGDGGGVYDVEDFDDDNDEHSQGAPKNFPWGAEGLMKVDDVDIEHCKFHKFLQLLKSEIFAKICTWKLH